MPTEQHLRRFSLEEDFMNWKTDDLVYGFLRSISTAHPTDKIVDGKQQYEEYLTLKDYKKNKKVLAGICGVTTQAIKKKIDRLEEFGLIQEKEILVNGEMVNSYVFPYDYDGRYKMIEKEMLEYLVSTRNTLAIRVYLYLLNCSTMKKNYVFTIREISQAFGYAESTDSANKIIDNNLKSFQKEGIIDFDYEIQSCISNKTGAETTTKRMVLKFVKTKKNF